MKITAITTRIVNADMRNWVFVKVETDEAGLFGWGEATLEWKTRAVVGAIEDLTPMLVGRDPRDIEQAVRVMKKQSFWRLGVIGMSAISGIEMALWDILGKHLGVPVWRLLGGKVRDKVQVYTHLGLGDMRAVYETLEVAPLVERAREVVEKGYRAFKAVFIPYTHYHAPFARGGQGRPNDGIAPSRRRPRRRGDGRLPRAPRERERGSGLHRGPGAGTADVRRGAAAARRDRGRWRRWRCAPACRSRQASGSSIEPSSMTY